MTFPDWYDIVTPGLLDTVLVFLAEVIVFAVPATLLTMWFRGRPAKLNAAFVFAAVLASLAIAYGLGLLYSHPAPYQVRPDTILSGPPENAFPSQHATVVFGMVWPLFALGRRQLSAIFLGIAVLVSVGRVAVGMHYPVDIVGSILASLLGFGLMWLASDYVSVLSNQIIDFEARMRKSLLETLR